MKYIFQHDDFGLKKAKAKIILVELTDLIEEKKYLIFFTAKVHNSCALSG